MTRRASIALGIERIGLIGLRAPRLTLALLCALVVWAVAGVTMLKVNDALDALLRSDTEIYAAFERMRERFPTSELDVIAIARLDGGLNGESLARLREVHLDLGLADGVADITSIFSVHEADGAAGGTRTIIPDELPEGRELETLIARLASDPLISPRLLAQPGDGSVLAVIVLGLDKEMVAEHRVDSVVTSLVAEAKEIGTANGIALAFTGPPVMKAEILLASRNDSVVFNIAGFAIGLMICLVFFQKLRLVGLVITPTALSVLAVLGAIGHLGIALNPLMNTVIPLVMVISFANALHLVFAMRHGLADGKDRRVAISDAVMTVGPACVLSALTTAIAFASLGLTDSTLVSEFGLTCAVATTFSLLLVSATTPCLALYLLPAAHAAQSGGVLPDVARGFDNAFAALSTWVVRHATTVAPMGLAVIGLCSLLYVQLEPRYRLSDIIPSSGDAGPTARILDRHFAGINAIHVMITGETGLTSPRAIAAIGEVHRLLENIPDLRSTTSIETIRRALPADRTSTSAAWLDDLPESLMRRFFSTNRQTGIVTSTTSDQEAALMEDIRLRIEAGLAGVAARHPELRFDVTGLATVSAVRAIDTISSLNRGLVVAVVVVLVLLGVLFRSLEMAALSLVANIFAVVGAATWLYLADIGLQYVSVVGLTVAFGLAVDDTVHFLNHYRLALDQGLDTRQAVTRTVARLGPILALTTIVIACGLATTLLSDVPPTRTFGLLCIFVLGFALIGDVVILPASVVAYGKLKGTFARRREA